MLFPLLPHGRGTVARENETGVGMTSFAELNPTVEEDSTLEGVPEVYMRPQALYWASYRVSKDDTISELAKSFGLNQDTLISMNNIRNSRLIQIGQLLRIPNQDGIVYKIRRGDTLSGIAEKYGTSVEELGAVNELFSDTLATGSSLFVPGAKLDWADLQEINGDLFIWPVRGYVSSNYGFRSSPFSGARQFHTGLDIAAPMGTWIKAAQSGRVAAVGYNDSNGNYVILSHHSGYRTLYCHMSSINVKAGSYVKTGDRIGRVGSTGLSTGPHLHFTVYKNGKTVNPRLYL